MSAIELIFRYLQERARLRLFLPLSLALALAGHWMAQVRPEPSALMLATLQALGLVLAFRVWDDLADRDSDRTRHPTRVMATSPSVAPFYLLGLGLLGTVALLFGVEALTVRRVAAVSIASAVIAVWYHVRPTDGRHPVLNEHVVALKYPVFAYAVAPEVPDAAAAAPRAAISLAVLYLLACLWQYADDVELRQLLTFWRSVP